MTTVFQERISSSAFTARSGLLQAPSAAVQKLKSLLGRNQQALIGTTASNAKCPPDTKTFLLSEIRRLERELLLLDDDRSLPIEALDIDMSQREFGIRYGAEGARVDSSDKLEIAFTLMRIDLLRLLAVDAFAGSSSATSYTPSFINDEEHEEWLRLNLHRFDAVAATELTFLLERLVEARERVMTTV